MPVLLHDAQRHEAFGGNGERARICRDCRRMPKAKLAALKHEEEIFGFLKQSHISDKNVARLQTLARSTDPRIADIAALALEVAQVQRYKRRRLRILAQKRPDLLTRLEETGLILAHHW